MPRKKAEVIEEDKTAEDPHQEEIDYEKYEKETSINFNELEEFASVFTCDKGWQKEIEGCGIKPVIKNKDGSRQYYIPKDCIKPPKIGKNYDVSAINRKARKIR